MKNRHHTTYILFILLFLTPVVNAQTVWKVGPGRTYKKPGNVSNLIKDGDIVEIDNAVYENDFVVWAKNGITLKGVNGRPHLKATAQPANGKAIWVTAGNNIRIENIEFSGCTVPDKNGAGIRAEGGGLVVSRCYFHHNQNGILQGIQKKYNLTIEYSEFYQTGSADGTGYTHNVYIGAIDTLFFRYNYSHDAAGSGHELKSRASNNFIEYNIISNENTADSRTIDICNGGYAVLIGNVITQSPYTTNYHILGYGQETMNTTVPNVLYLVNNTFLNTRNNGIFVQTKPGANKIYAYNNVFAGKYEGLIITNGSPSVPIDSAGNIVSKDIQSLRFKNYTQIDLSLTEGSPAIGRGINPGQTTTGYPLMPRFQFHKSFEVNPRTSAIDAGAYQYPGSSVTTELGAGKGTSGINVSAKDGILRIISLSGEIIKEVQIFDIQGKMIVSIPELNALEYSFSFPETGKIYIVKVKGNTVTSHKLHIL